MDTLTRENLTCISVPKSTREIVRKIAKVRRWASYVAVDEAVRDFARREGIVVDPDPSSQNDVNRQA